MSEIDHEHKPLYHVFNWNNMRMELQRKTLQSTTGIELMIFRIVYLLVGRPLIIYMCGETVIYKELTLGRTCKQTDSCLPPWYKNFNVDNFFNIEANATKLKFIWQQFDMTYLVQAICRFQGNHVLISMFFDF